jgi:hypothetical protein
MDMNPHRSAIRKMPAALGAALLILLVSTSCQVRQEVQIAKDGSGSVEFDIELASYFTEVVDQLEQVAPAGEGEEMPEEGNIFQVEKLRADFAAREEVTLESLSNPSPQKLRGTLSFESIERALTKEQEELGSGELFSFERSGGVSTLRVLVNYETFSRLLDENPSFNSPLMENFGPMANRGLNEAEYLDMMEYALGPESRRGIKESEMRLTVQVEGTIVSHQGGTRKNGRTVVFEIPLLDLLILDEPVERAVSFR